MLGSVPGYVYRDAENNIVGYELVGIMSKYYVPNNGYRLFKDSYCEQWGVSSNNNTITFPRPFKDTNYTVVLTGGGHTGSGADIAPYLSTKTTTTCSIIPDRSINFNWIAVGYAN